MLDSMIFANQAEQLLSQSRGGSPANLVEV